MAPAHSHPRLRDSTPDSHVLRLGIDLGTGKIQIAGQHIQSTAARHDAVITPVCLEGDQTARIAQIAILPEAGDVIYGTVKVEEAIAADPTLQDRVLELWKLALHPEFQHLEEVEHVLRTLFAQTDEQIDRGAIQDFMGEQLEGIIRDIRDFYKSSYRNAGKDVLYWDHIPLELQISVPAMWGDDQRGLVCNAACKALAGSHPNNKVELREEPLCVATVYMLDLVTGGIEEGECLLLIDCGKGTLDIATVKLIRAPTKDVLMQLQRIGPCSGNGAGSHMINTEAWNWITSGGCEEVQDLAKVCTQLGITRREFLRQFSKEIDRVKDETYIRFRVVCVAIRSSHGKTGNGRIPRLLIDIQPQIIQTWYKKWTDSATQLVKEHLDKQGTENFRCASLTGGGCLSTAFKTAIKSVLEQAPYGIEIATPTACISPCSQGALLQHYFQGDKLPSVANFYLALNEEYQREIHKDAATQGSKYKPHIQILPERLQRIMRYENGKFSGAAKTPLRFLVEDNGIDDRIHVDVYYSEEDLEDHSALRTDDGALRPGIRSYPLISVDLESLSDNGFKAKGGGNSGTRHFEVKTYVQMHGNEDSLELKIEVMQNFYHFPGERYGQAYDKDSVLWTFNRQLWNKSMSHFVRDITGTAGPVKNAALAASTVTTGAASAANPALPSTLQNASLKRKTNASTNPANRKTPQRATRNRVISYAEDQDMEDD